MSGTGCDAVFKIGFQILLGMTMGFGAFPAAQGLDTPVGRWQTISDVTGQANGVVEIAEESGELVGRLVAGAKPGMVENQVCDKCTGDRHNKPLLGILILSGLRKQADEWIGGEILDPDTGRIYKAKLRLEDGGKKLQVRGYLGIPLLGRTQVWQRML